jgi:hypothetical protein
LSAKVSGDRNARGGQMTSSVAPVLVAIVDDIVLCNAIVDLNVGSSDRCRATVNLAIANRGRCYVQYWSVLNWVAQHVARGVGRYELPTYFVQRAAIVIGDSYDVALRIPHARYLFM